jgi:hypothetical protein
VLRGKALAATGAEIVGSTVGAFVALVGGIPAGSAAGVLTTRLLTWAGGEIAERVLAPREEKRIGAALWVVEVRARAPAIKDPAAMKRRRARRGPLNVFLTITSR